VHDQQVHAADTSIADIFSFNIVDGAADTFKKQVRTVLISASVASQYFGDAGVAGKRIQLFTLGDTITYTVAAVFVDFPHNTHEPFNIFIGYDSAALETLKFNAGDMGVYGRITKGSVARGEAAINRSVAALPITYRLQPLPQIYFGPAVAGEDVRHGDAYSISILCCITALIFFLALTGFMNLTTLTLPYRAKEIAIKKLAGTSGMALVWVFGRESLAVVSVSFVLGVALLVVGAPWVSPILSLDVVALLLRGDALLLLIMATLFVLLGLAPLAMVTRFTAATPSRLLGTEAITFPRFKRVITLLQLGISLFLIVASMVVRRQVTYSLLKEPGRNHDQVVYLRYPEGLTSLGLRTMRNNWQRTHPNIVDVIATSQLPYDISSKSLEAGYYRMAVEPAYKDFFRLEMVEGRWFKVNDGDSLAVVNEAARLLPGYTSTNVIGVIKDMNGQFNMPEKPVRMNVAPYYNYNFLCVRILEVDIRRTVNYLSATFSSAGRPAAISFLNKRFEGWLAYQDRLNALSQTLALISALLSALAIYGLSVSLVRDKLKKIALHKMYGATSLHVTGLLMMEFARPMLVALLIFTPITFIVISELLRNFVYHTQFTWLDPFIPLAYCGLVIAGLCGYQARSLDRRNLTGVLKG
jgi:putative ABC transport system permease protein